MNILVVGGAGYIGSHVVYELCDKGFNTFVLDNLSTGSEDNIDTARNTLASAIETALETDITRNSKALDTEVISLETDAGTLFPYGAISMVVRVIYEHDSATP